MKKACIAAVLLAASSGCYRAAYTGFAPAGTAAEAVTAPRSSPWRSFYVYGYLPREVVVDAAAECGGAARVYEIRTRQSFTQALIRMFATSGGVNAYAPWTAEVICADDHSRSP
jgi:hypothetical protein